MLSSLNRTHRRSSDEPGNRVEESWRFDTRKFLWGRARLQSKAQNEIAVHTRVLYLGIAELRVKRRELVNAMLMKSHYEPHYQPSISTLRHRRYECNGNGYRSYKRTPPNIANECLYDVSTKPFDSRCSALGT